MPEVLNKSMFRAERRSNPMRIKTMFMSSILRETAEKIRGEQTAIVEMWDLFESGRLKNFMTGHFSVMGTDGDNNPSGKLTMRYLVYARFLDMYRPWIKKGSAKRVYGYHLYNRITYGTLYNYTMPELTTGFTQALSEEIREKLREIQGAAVPFYKKQEMQIQEIAKTDRQLAALISKSMRRGYGY